MEEEAPVFIDAGPLIILARTGHLTLLRDLFGRVLITAVVKDEVLPGENRPGEAAIARGIAEGYIVPTDANAPTLHQLPREIDDGERSIIEAGASVPGALIILDDLDARSCAKKLETRACISLQHW